MPKNKVVYFLINFAFIFCALLFINGQPFLSNNLSVPSIIVIMLLFLLIHLARFVRMYFILLEDLIRPNRFLQLYLKTTFVSTLIPFKIGELFKMYCYGVETGKTLTGIIAVFIEKFFDALILCIFITPYALGEGTLSPLLLVLLLFVAFALVLYFTFGNTYRYLNNFLIRRGGGQKSLAFLKILEGLKKAYDGAKHTLQGRFIILFLLSLIAWSIEGVLIVILNSGGLSFDPSVIFGYISDGFFGIANVLFSRYSSLCAIIFIPLLLIIYLRKYLPLFKKQERSQHGKTRRSL